MMNYISPEDSELSIRELNITQFMLLQDQFVGGKQINNFMVCYAELKSAVVLLRSHNRDPETLCVMLDMQHTDIDTYCTVVTCQH